MADSSARSSAKGRRARTGGRAIVAVVQAVAAVGPGSWSRRQRPDSVLRLCGRAGPGGIARKFPAVVDAKHGALSVPLFASIDAEVVAVMDGGFGAQDAGLGGIGLIVELYRVALDAVLDTYSFDPAFEVLTTSPEKSWRSWPLKVMRFPRKRRTSGLEKVVMAWLTQRG